MALGIAYANDSILFMGTKTFVTKSGYNPGGCHFRGMLLNPRRDIKRTLFKRLTEEIAKRGVPLVGIDLGNSSIACCTGCKRRIIVCRLTRNRAVSIRSRGVLTFARSYSCDIHFVNINMLSRGNLTASALATENEGTCITMLSSNGPIMLDGINEGGAVSMSPSTIVY